MLEICDLQSRDASRDSSMLSNFLEKDRILSVLSHLRDYIIFSSFPFLFMSISNDQVRTCESNPGRKINITIDSLRKRLIKFDERRIMYLKLVDRYPYIAPC